MKRTVLKLILVAASALSLAACSSSPAKPEAPAAPAIQTSTTDLMLQIRKAELELERTEQMAWLKFAVESNSDMVKGFVMGRSGAGKGGAGGGSTSQAILQAQAQADATALRREELAERSSWWNRGLQLFDRAVPVLGMVQGYRLQKRQMDISADQYKYTLDAIGGAQQGAYDFGTSVLDRKTDYLLLPHGTTSMTPGLGTSTGE